MDVLDLDLDWSRLLRPPGLDLILAVCYYTRTTNDCSRFINLDGNILLFSTVKSGKYCQSAGRQVSPLELMVRLEME